MTQCAGETGERARDIARERDDGGTQRRTARAREIHTQHGRARGTALITGGFGTGIGTGNGTLVTILATGLATILAR